jgi:hypothetical protein
VKKRVSSLLAATGAALAALTVMATPAHAVIKSICTPDGNVCTAADVYNTGGSVPWNVRDVTVSVRDHQLASLHIFIARDVDTWRNSVTVYRIDVDRNYKSGTLVCGEAWRNNKSVFIGRACLTL